MHYSGHQKLGIKPAVFVLILGLLAGQARPADDGPLPGINLTGLSSGFSLKIMENPVPSFYTFSLQSEQSPSAAKIPDWLSGIKMSAILEGESRIQKFTDVTNIESNGSSDLYLRDFQFYIESTLMENVTASAVIITEWLGDDVNQGDGIIGLDQATIEANPGKIPVYLVLGKRTQPFGIFQNHLLMDPMTKDAYETKKVKLTFGYSGPVDFNITIYKGTEQMDHLLDSGLFGTGIVMRNDPDVRNVGSFILSVAPIKLLDSLQVFAAFLSEPGWNSRNTTLDLGFSLQPASFKHLMIDGEYVKALARELYTPLDQAIKEGVISLSATYHFIVRKRKNIGSGSFRLRRSQIESHPLSFCIRVEHFDDDGLTERLPTWSVNNRMSLGGNWTFSQVGNFIIYGGLEFRRSTYRVNPDFQEMRSQNSELYLLLGITY